MLKHGFLHIPTVGEKTEHRIWDSGIKTLNEFLIKPPKFMSSKKHETLKNHIIQSKKKIEDRDALYFYNNLQSKEHWRLFGDFLKTCAYVDIETTGLAPPWDIITTIALYDGKEIKHYINGKNLHEFKKDIKQYEVIVTYNGKSFDVPFIESCLKTKIPHAHLDLRYILRSMGYSGGLKDCERQLGIGRVGALADVDGYLAVLLWYDYKRTKKEKTLETLLSYNIEDVLNLEYLMVTAYNMKLDNIPFHIKRITMPKQPKNPFKIDAATVNRIQREQY